MTSQKKSLHLVAPAYRELAAALPTFGYTPESVDSLRQALSDVYAQVYGAPESVHSEVVEIARGEAAPLLRGLLFRPKSQNARGALLHIHGGGWVAGSAAAFAPFCASIADVHDLLVLSVDYRLIPEAAGDAALEDCFDALKWLIAHAEELGIDRTNISMLGDSAGGNLAAGTALLARDAGLTVRSQLLVYPVLDDRTATKNAISHNEFAGEFVVDRSYLRQIWDARLSTADRSKLNYLAPARAESLVGLPPTFIATGSIDLFVDESIDYAARLARSGVPIELHVYDGVFHGFDLFPGPETDRFKSDLRSALRRLTA